MNKKKICPICKTDKVKYAFSYKKNTAEKGGRKWYRCGNCLTFNGKDIKNSIRYQEGYYPSVEYIKKRFNSINTLPNRESNNFYRVERLKKHIKEYEMLKLLKGKKRKILDVGCGFGIFLYKFLKSLKGWKGIGADLDHKLKGFLKHIGIDMVVISDMSKLRGRFDLVSFNRVLEHVKDPLTLLKKANTVLKETGVIYIEVPDMLSHPLQGAQSDAFTDDHFLVFSPESICRLAKKAGLRVLDLSRIMEINGKLTIYAFLARRGLKNEVL